MILILNAGKQTKKQPAFSIYNARMFHLFWKLFLAPLKECYDGGGFYLTVGGVMRRFLPVIAYFIQDSPEGALLCACKIGAEVHNPCRVCWCSRENANNPFDDSEKREEVRNL